MIPGSANTLLAYKAAGASAYQIQRSLRFNSADSAYLSRTYSTSLSDSKLQTFAAWVKRTNPGVQADYVFYGYNGSSTNATGLLFLSDNTLEFRFGGTPLNNLTTTQVFRDPSAWFHLLVAIDTTQATASNRVKIYINGSQVTTFSATNYPSQNATSQFGLANSNNKIAALWSSTGFCNAYLADIHFIDGQALDPTSFGEFDANGIWQPKAYSGTYGTNGFRLDFADNSSAAALGYDAAGSNDWTVNNLSLGLTGKPVIYVTYTGGAVGAGVYSASIGSVSNLGSYSGDTWTATNSGWVDTWDFGSDPGVTSFTLSNWNVGSYSNQTWYLSNDSSFSSGTVTGPNSGTIADGTHSLVVSGTRYRYLRLQNIPSATYSLFSVRSSPGAGCDSLVDSPTNYGTDTGAGGEVRGNYCTLNPLNNGGLTLSDGNLQSVRSTSSWVGARATIGITSGKWYWEYTVTNHIAGQIGINTASGTLANYAGNSANAYVFDTQDGTKWSNNSSAAYFGSASSNGQVHGIAFDADAGTITFYRNGTTPGVAYSSIPAEIYFPVVSQIGGESGVANFGQRPFAYTAPSGFKALCTANLPTPTITKGSSVMDVVTYTGTGSTLTPTSSLGFSPDLVWIKGRSGATDNTLYDTVRGVEARLESNTTDAEVTSDGGLTAFNSNGFTLGTLAQVNTNTATYAAWCWDGGSSTVTNTSGTISSQVRANATAGFSVVTFTMGSGSNTVGHGLNAVPGLVICTTRNGTSNWWAFMDPTLGSDKYLSLQKTDAAATLARGTSTSSVFAVDNNFFNNTLNHVAYCFAPVAGYSAFGSYTGNGSADGPFVYLGFRPALVIVKMSSSTGNWTMLDTKREGYNVDNDPLYPNLSNVEGTADLIDITSNGFKVRTTDATFNTNTGTYVYAAWAENPFSLARAR